MNRQLASRIPAPADAVGAILRVRSEYLEMPGLHLTCDQAARLVGLDPRECARVLHELVADGFLLRTARGGYLRADLR